MDNIANRAELENRYFFEVGPADQQEVSSCFKLMIVKYYSPIS